MPDVTNLGLVTLYCLTFLCYFISHQVAFVYFQVVNDGMSVVGSAGRVVEEYKEYGLMNEYLYPYAMEDITSTYPTIKEQIYTTIGSHGHDRGLVKFGEIFRAKIVLRWVSIQTDCTNCLSFSGLGT